MAAKASLAKAWSLLKEQALSGQGGHSALLELSSRMAGFQHWHEAHERGKAAAAGPAADRGSPRAVGIELAARGPRLGGPGGEGARVDFAGLKESHPAAFSAAALALALSFPAPPFWSRQAWRERARGLAQLLPEAQAAMAALGEPSSVAFLSSWEGISRVRTLMDKTDPEGLGSRWVDWARPWHSVFSPEGSEARQSYEPMARAWAGAQELMERLEAGGADWRGLALAGRLAVDPGGDGAWLALAQALLRSEGLKGELAHVERLGPEAAKAGLAFFPPS